MTALDTNVRYAKGIGQQRAMALEKLEIHTLYDLISFFPRDYEDRSVVRPLDSLADGERACVKASVVTAPVLERKRQGMTLVRFRIADDSGAANVTYFNQPYIRSQLTNAAEYLFFGRFQKNGPWLELTNPVFEKAGEAGGSTGRIVPVYRLTAGVSQKVLSRAVEQALAAVGDGLPDLLPPSVAEKHKLVAVPTAYHNIHFPETMADAAAARQRLVFEELFALACALGSLKDRRKSGAGWAVPQADPAPFYQALPFTLTGAQRRAVAAALGDMASGLAMNRLIQGDVGSGKTVVAAACIWAVKQAGLQAAFMAPTELLADQHYATLGRLLEPFGVRTVLLKGGMSAREKREARELIALGQADLAVGTHALLSEDVEFQNLALAVTDEQHRFGVRQRAALSAKAAQPHVLVMSATPIPRTLALMIYGDLDVSVIDELPPGRQKVDTFAVGESMRPRIQRFIARLVGEGRQVYIVCPMIEEGEQAAEDLQSAKALYAQLSGQVFPKLRVALLHGKLKAQEKEAVMAAFAGGETDILVSTTVVEVGVDVPNAALMVVENAERFGLSQLHQLRGRVGRGQHKSYCVLFQGKSGAGQARLDVLTKSNDGFQIAEEDLKLRGPGDFFGARQHGLPELKVADLASSLEVLRQAQAEAAALLARDPALAAYPALRERIQRMYRGMEA